jgi:hypothetical protein
MVIIGISAKKQGGKSTLVDHLLEKVPQSTVVRFADSLKQIVLDCFVPSEFGWKTPDDLDLEEHKMRVLPCGRTVREMLQIVGTNWFRHAWDDCWINAYKKRLAAVTGFLSREGAAVIFTPDVRFPNELRMVQSMGGKVFRLLRDPFNSADQHESETALDEILKDNISTMAAESSLPKQWEVAVFHPPAPGKLFDLVYDNREKTLDETKVWVNERLMKCFSWNGNSEGISNMEFDLTKLVDYERKEQ